MHILICLFAQKMPNLIKSQIFVFLFEFCSAIDLIMGQNALVLVLLYLSIMKLLEKVYEKLHENQMVSFMSFASLITMYFFYITGHRC